MTKKSIDLSFLKANQLTLAGHFMSALEVYLGILDVFPGNLKVRNAANAARHKALNAVNGSLLMSVCAELKGAELKNAAEVALSHFTALQGSIDYHMTLGHAFMQLLNWRQAKNCFQFARLLRPADITVNLNLGNAYFQLKEFESAEYAFKKILSLDVNNPNVLNNLAMCLGEQGKFGEAELFFKRGIKLDPQSAATHFNLANTLRDKGDLEQAILFYERALEIKPDYVKAANNLGTVLHQFGRNNEAENAYMIAVKNDPDNAQAYRNLSAVHRFTIDEPILPLILSRRVHAATQRDRMYFDFTLAKPYDDIQDFDKAFFYLRTANLARKKMIGYDYSSDSRLFSEIKRMTIKQLPSFNPKKTAVPIPIFIVGMMRSGTTLIEQIISTHSKVFGGGEREILNQLCVPIMESFHAQNRVPSIRDITHIRQTYQTDGQKIAQSKPFLTDKMPLNFRWIGFILASFPEARIIRLRRDPVATCFSIYKHYFSSDGNGYAFDLADIIKFFKDYEALMEHWYKLFPGRIHDVWYEALTEQPELHSKALIAACGLEWEDRCLNFHMNGKAVKTASAAQVKQPIYKNSSEAWRSYENNLGDLIEALKPLKN